MSAILSISRLPLLCSGAHQHISNKAARESSSVIRQTSYSERDTGYSLHSIHLYSLLALLLRHKALVSCDPTASLSICQSRERAWVDGARRTTRWRQRKHHVPLVMAPACSVCLIGTRSDVRQSVANWQQRVSDERPTLALRCMTANAW